MDPLCILANMYIKVNEISLGTQHLFHMFQDMGPHIYF